MTAPGAAPGKRAKSESQEHTSAPCSMAMAARWASVLRLAAGRAARPQSQGDDIFAALNTPVRAPFDAVARTVDLLVDDATLASRRTAWKLPPPRYTTGVLAKFARLVTGAEKGAVTEA